MMEFLEFTFQSIWHFLGVLILVSALSAFIPDITINKKK